MSSTACEVLQTTHRAVQQASSTLRVVKSVIRERVSVHTMSDPTPFSNMFSFQKIATGASTGSKTFVGSMTGELVFSVNTAYTPPEPTRSGKKRSLDTSTEDAERAIAKVRRSSGSETISNASFKAAQECVASLIKLKGAKGESVIESWAVSLRKSGQWGAGSTGPSLVIAARMTAGVAIPLGTLCNAMRVCRDGMLAVSTDRIHEEFDLPLTDQGVTADERGQKSVLVFASVPNLEDSVSEAK